VKKFFVLTALFLTVITLICSSQTGDTLHQSPEKARNIILMIGDGMGISHLHAAMVVNRAKLNVEQFNDIGFTKTHSASSFVTDSGAAGTAIATGHKTYNSGIGVDHDTIPRTSILEYASEHGKSTGMVVTCAITHATPAAFYAHQESRDMHEAIASDLVSSVVDVFVGGGLKYFNNRSDRMDLTKLLAERDYQIVSDIPQLEQVDSGKIAGLLYKNHPPRVSKGRGEMLSIAAGKAIEILSQHPQGFFLMIEGSQIDWGGHDHDTEYIVEEMIDFDKVIGLVLDFAKRDQNTLVIVTADHESGGMALNDGDLTKGAIVAKYTTGDHTGVMVPVFAYGPQSELFRGIYDNTGIFFRMMQAFGIEPREGKP
jgi:alkaline phosphatase